jgi:DNA-binding MarR family transcriptional regulator
MPARPLPPGTTDERLSRLANRLNSGAIHLLRRIGRDDAADGLTGARASALSVLVYGGVQKLGSLAAREGVAAPTMTRIVEALVQDGLVRREVAPGDRRAVVLEATPRGRQVMERGRARRIQRLAEELSHLAPDEIATLERAVEVLERLETAVQEERRRT